MQHVKLSHLNPEIKINGNEQRKSLRLQSVKLLSPPDAETVLQIRMLDEKNMPVFSRELPFAPGQPEITIEHELVFYDHMAITICNQQKEGPFEVELAYE